MAVKRWNGSSWVDAGALERWNGATFTPVADVKRWDGATWVAVSFMGGGADLSVSVSPGSATVTQFSPEPAPNIVELTTGTVVATASGGTGPYSYAWTKVSGSSVPQVNSPASASTSWTGNVPKNQGPFTATWRVTVTDSLSATGTADIIVRMNYTTDI